MLRALDKQDSLTGNQYRLMIASCFGVMLEFLDYFLIGFILTFLATPWHLTFGISAIILLSSGVGAIIGAFMFGHLADRIGRRKIFLTTVATFSVAMLALIFTPEARDPGWLYLTACRFVIGLGVGGLYWMRGVMSGVVTATVPLGLLTGSVMVAFLEPIVGGWRPLMGVCVALSLLTFFMLAWIPESPRWLISRSENEKARRSIAWALETDPKTLPLTSHVPAAPHVPFSALFHHPRRLIVSCVTNLGVQTGYYGLALWAPSLIVLLLHATPKQAAFYMIFATLSAFVGRFVISILSELMGRRAAGTLVCAMAGIMLAGMGLFVHQMEGNVLAVVLPLMATFFFGDGCFAIAGPYSAEVWPSGLRTTGMGAAYGFGGIGKIIGPLGLAVVVGTSLTLTPKPGEIPINAAFTYFAVWYFLAAATYWLCKVETKGQSIEAIDEALSTAGGSRAAE